MMMTERPDAMDFPQRISLKLSLAPRHSKILLKIQERLQISNPSETLRTLLELRAKHLLIRINDEVHQEIKSLLTIPIVREIIKGEDFNSFVEWSLNQAIPTLFDLIGTIEDPMVRLSLRHDQLKVAARLWQICMMPEYRNGIPIPDLAKNIQMDPQELRTILLELEMLGLVEKVKILSGGEVTWRIILNR